MCLSVYLGTSRPLSLPAVQAGELGMEDAQWTPPPLKRREFIYYIGRQAGEAKPLQCSCLLLEHVNWTESGPEVEEDATYSAEQCSFDALRQLCDLATQGGGIATIVCDDSNGLEQSCLEEDYCEGLVRLHSIARGNLLFAEVSGGIPWRVLHVVR